jgi:hypothetical protein
VLVRVTHGEAEAGAREGRRNDRAKIELHDRSALDRSRVRQGDIGGVGRSPDPNAMTRIRRPRAPNGPSTSSVTYARATGSRVTMLASACGADSARRLAAPTRTRLIVIVPTSIAPTSLEIRRL